MSRLRLAFGVWVATIESLTSRRRWTSLQRILQDFCGSRARQGAELTDVTDRLRAITEEIGAQKQRLWLMSLSSMACVPAAVSGWGRDGNHPCPASVAPMPIGVGTVGAPPVGLQQHLAA